MLIQPYIAINKFKGFSINDATLALPPKADGTNLLANTTVPNPTVLHLDIGTMNLDIEIGDLVVGNASLQDVTVVPGDNTFPMTACQRSPVQPPN